MSREELIQQKIIQRFPSTESKFRMQRERRIWVEIPLAEFLLLFEFAKEELNFAEFCTMTGLDEGANLGFIYHLAQERTGIMLNIKIAAPKSEPVIPTVTGFFPSAELPEREVEALLGAKVEGLAAGRRYPLSDDWPENDHPLLKDWKPVAEREKAEVPNA